MYPISIKIIIWGIILCSYHLPNLPSFSGPSLNVSPILLNIVMAHSQLKPAKVARRMMASLAVIGSGVPVWSAAAVGDAVGAAVGAAVVELVVVEIVVVELVVVELVVVELVVVKLAGRAGWSNVDGSEVSTRINPDNSMKYSIDPKRAPRNGTVRK